MRTMPGNAYSASFVLLIGALGAGCSYATVGPGQVGVVWTPSGTRPNALPEGNWSIGYFDHAAVYDTRSQERDEKLEVLASNGLRIELDASIRYHIVPAEAVKLDAELGAHYYDVLIGPTLRSQARRVVGRFQPEEIYSSQRELVERQIREGVEKAIAGRHVVLEAVLVRNVTLPDSIQQAINDKLQAEQQALKMKFVLVQAESEAQKRLIEQKAEADRARIAAQSKAETDRIEAEGQAEAKRIEAQATADYERLIELHLTDPMLRWQEIEALRTLGTSNNAKVIFVGGNHASGTLFELK